MLFNSFEFLFMFLPFVFIVYFLLGKLNLIVSSKIWLVFSSLFFYGWWNIAYLPLLIFSLFVNYLVGSLLCKEHLKFNRKLLLTSGIILNLSLLGYFKYADFFISNFNTLFDTNNPLLGLILPLAISFFTFQQIAYLVDAYRKETKEYNFLNYALFVTFFPQLIAGPIVHHKEVMPQFEMLDNNKINLKNISLGIFIFSIGIFKKVAIADTFALWATEGFDHTSKLTFFEAWLTSLSYTFQIYFDFSGYTDMAIGIALLFNIVLPINFNSPYKALNIQDFWRKWHITLSRFLTHYIYIPLGGNRKGNLRTYLNILIVFLVSGIWHGAGWTFVLWGLLHGLASAINRYWKQFGIKMNVFIAWFITFNFINITWVFFRANSWEDAAKVFKGMLGFNGFSLPTKVNEIFPFSSELGFSFSSFFLSDREIFEFTLAMILAFLISILFKNSIELSKKFQPSYFNSIFIALLLAYSALSLTKVSEFLYFNF